jgi:signal transduction histidine kinase/ligand-binding sensor domain-containing protein
MKRFFFSSVCLLFFISLLSQEKRGIEHYGVEEGLSQGTTFDIAQDENGFIWIATADGLNRFDGINFKIFKSDPTDSFSLRHSNLRNLLAVKNALWITTIGSMELYRIDLITQKIKKVYSFISADGEGDVQPFKEDADTLWVIATGYGVVKLNWKTGKIIQQFSQAVNSYPVNSIVVFDAASSTLWYVNKLGNKLCSFSLLTEEFHERTFIDSTTHKENFLASITIGKDKKIMIGIGNGILVFNPVSNEFSTYFFSSQSEMGTVELVGSLLETDGNKLWCGTDKGSIYLFDESEKTFARQNENSSGTIGIKHRTIKFMMDKTKNLWIGTDPDGIYKIDTKGKPFNHTFYDPKNENGLRSNFIKCFLQIKNETYIGTYDQGINIYNANTGTYRLINGFNDAVNNLPAINSMVEDSSGRIFVGTDQGLGMIEKGNTYLTRPNLQGKNDELLLSATSVYVLGDQSLIVGTIGGMYELKKNNDTYQLITFSIEECVEDLLIDRAGNLWVSSAKGIYFSKRNATGIFGDLKLVVKDIGKVKCIYQADDGTIWAGSVTGLHKINTAQQRIEKSYSEKNGMPNSFVYGIVGDEKQNLWISTNKGISKFNPQTETFRNYSVSDGLQSNEFNTGAYYQSLSGELFFGGVNGFNHFFANEIKDNPFVPHCLLTGLKIFDKPFVSDSSIENKKHITLDYTNTNLLLEYAALEFSDPSKNNFKYRLKGLDSNWVNAGNERFARFVNLSPGEYVFQLKAANNDGLWNEQPMEFRITITPPFWKTTSFIFSMIVIGLMLSFVSIRFYLTRQLKIKTRELELKQSVRMNAIIETEEKERKRIAGELHDGLGQLLSTARLNIAGLDDNVENKDSVLLKNSLQLLDEACAEVRTISHNMMPGALIRLGLMAAVNELINKINDTEKLKIEFDTNLEERFSETIEIALYRIVQEVLNNMVRHAEAKNIRVKMGKSKGQLEIRIVDDGKSFDVSQIANSEGLGWKNIYSRVEILNGSINVESEKGKGTSIFIFIPLS